MGKRACEACGAEGATVTQRCDDSVAPYRLCADCDRRLIARSLRPAEWYGLASRYGWWPHSLHDDFYDQDGSALQPDAAIEEAARFPAPVLEDVKSSVERLFGYSASRWNLEESLMEAWSAHSKSDVLRVLERGFARATNDGVRSLVIDLASRVLGSDAQEFLSRIWDEASEDVEFEALARASARSMNPRDGWERVCSTLGGLSGRDLEARVSVLSCFRLEATLDWIERHPPSIVTETWGNVAALLWVPENLDHFLQQFWTPPPASWRPWRV